MKQMNSIMMRSMKVCNLTIYWNVNLNVATNVVDQFKVCNLTIYWNVNHFIVAGDVLLAIMFVI